MSSIRIILLQLTSTSYMMIIMSNYVGWMKAKDGAKHVLKEQSMTRLKFLEMLNSRN